jgi:hypothetical protein
MRNSMRSITAAAVLAMLAVVLPATVQAAAPTGQFVNFKYCPYANQAASTCVFVKSPSGSLTAGKLNVPITSSKPLVVQGAIGQEVYPEGTPWFDAVGADVLPQVRRKVPGGLLGFDLYATIELTAQPDIHLTQLGIGEKPGLELPARIHLESPLLGSNCYVGSAADPIAIDLITGTTAPPPPNSPISGAFGVFEESPDTLMITVNGVKLVDNEFAVPAARNCGHGPLTNAAITAVVNRKLALPAAAGRNALILESSTVQVADARAVEASVQ